VKKVIRKILIGLSILLAIAVIAGVAIGVVVCRRDMPEDICRGVVKLEPITKDSGSIVSRFVNVYIGRYDAAGKCSCVAKTIENGDTIVGRNLDNTQNIYPIYIGSTNIEGFYRTVYATQLEDIGPSYESCVTKGVPKYMSVGSAFLATDSLNSEGLYIEINMRENQEDENGEFVFSCSGTNPESNVRLNVCELPTYLTLRCKDVEEAVDLIDTLDVYTPNDGTGWTLCLLLADAKGNYGVVEFGCNKAVWLPMQNIQTNFYISEDFSSIQLYKQGLGRYEYIDENLGSVSSEEDMLQLMKGVKYSEMYNISSPSFDTRSEFAEFAYGTTNEFLENDLNWNRVLAVFKHEADQFNSMTRDEREEESTYWISLFTSIVNCNKKTLSLSFFEEYEISYVLGFE